MTTTELIARAEAGLKSPAVIEELGEEETALFQTLLSEYKASLLAQSETVADSNELSPERQATLTLLLNRYDENLGRGLYTAESAPKAEVEKWLKQDPTRLDKAARWEARGGMPMFTGEENGEFCIDECSPEVPQSIRDISYGPNAAKYQFGDEGRNALTQAEKLGGTLMSKNRRQKLFDAGLIKDKSTWEWVYDESNCDLKMNDTEIENYGFAWPAGCESGNRIFAYRHSMHGGLRCSLRGKKA